jgi:anti-sigma factor RsiW
MSPSDEDPVDDPSVRERLTAYLDDRLSPEEARRFLAWLESHPAAWKEAEEARRVWALLGAYRDEQVSEGFSERVMARVRAEAAEGEEGALSSTAAAEPTSKPALRLLAGGKGRAVAAAAAVLVALGAGVLWGRFANRGPAVVGSAPAAVEAFNAMPADLLDRIDGDDVAQIAGLSDEEFEALLAPGLSDDGKGSGG